MPTRAMTRRVTAVEDRHLHVHQDHIGSRRSRLQNRRLAVAGLGHDDEVIGRFEDHADARSYHRLIVDQEYPRHVETLVAFTSSAGKAAATVNSVGDGVMATVPPWKATRSLMPSRPWPFVFGPEGDTGDP